MAEKSQSDSLNKDYFSEIPNETNLEENTLDALESKPKEELVAMVRSMTMEEYYSGPLPHPDILHGYEKILPGSADRILKMAESQSKHRQDIEKAVVNSNTRDGLLGIIAAFILGVVGILSGVWVALSCSPFAGAFLSTISIGSLVGTFIYGTRSEKRERQEKDRDN